MKILTDASYKLMEDTIAYWQAAYERERDRADRLQDGFLQTNGMAPISEAGAAKETARLLQLDKMKDDLKELLETETGQVVLTEEEKEAMGAMTEAIS